LFRSAFLRPGLDLPKNIPSVAQLTVRLFRSVISPGR
jgi:hypothetical protein